MSVAYKLVNHSRSRSLRLKVESDGTVVVTSPKGVARTIVENFVTQHQNWIKRAQLELSQRKKLALNDESVAVFGQQYAKKITWTKELPTGVHIQNQSLIVNAIEPNPSPAKTKELLNRFLKATAEKYIVHRVHQLAAIMAISFTKISLREQKSRWGSCSAQGSLQFNWRLVHYQPAIIDYVIVHELAHRVHMNHSTSFWNLVRQYDPEFQKHRGWLKRNGLSVG
jgi:predicted metal-dependent hydrolase